jgi:hypothetical protein
MRFLGQNEENKCEAKGDIGDDYQKTGVKGKRIRAWKMVLGADEAADFYPALLTMGL